MNVGGDIYQSVAYRSHDVLFGENGSGGIINYLATEFHTLATLFVTIFIVGLGYAMIRGKVDRDFIPSAVISMVIISITYQIAFTDGGVLFKQWLYEPIVMTSIKLTGEILANALNLSVSESFGALDEGFVKIFESASLRLDNLSFYDGEFWITYPIFGLLLVGYGILYASFLSTILVGIVAAHVLLAPGALMLVFAAFNLTRPIFFSWLRTLFTFALLAPFAAVVMSFSLRFVTYAVHELSVMPIEKGVFNSDIGFAFLIMIISFVLMQKVPEFAAAITGATPSSGGGLFGAAAAIGGGVMAAGVAGKSSMISGVGGLGRGAQGLMNPVEGHGRAYSAYLGITKGPST